VLIKEPTVTVNPEDIAGLECIHANYFVNQYTKKDDLVLVKERVHFKDGTTRSRLVPKINVKKSFYITREGHQTHHEKKEWEDRKKVQRYESTQVLLADNLARALGMTPGFMRLGMLNRSPYVYGTDIMPTVLVKHKYMRDYPEYNDARYDANNAVLDLETNTVFEHLHPDDKAVCKRYDERIGQSQARMDHLRQQAEEAAKDPKGAKDVKRINEQLKLEREEIVSLQKERKPYEQPIISGSLTMKDKVFIAVTKRFAARIQGKAVPIVEGLFELYLEKYKKERNINLEVEIVENDFEVTRALLKRAHQWQPDFILIWNMNFDVPKMIESCKRHGEDPAEVFSDPRIPPEYKYFRYKEGQLQKTKADGKTYSQHVADLWHTVIAPAGFYFIDSMCLYKKLRVTEAQQPSYSLDAILNRHLNLSKLKFEEADGFKGLEWHQFMQTHYPAEYLIYNSFDCIAVELLDEDQTDIKKMRILLGHSDLAKFPSTPRRLADDLHFVCEEEEGLVMGSTSDEMVAEIDALLPSLQGWITTLPSHLIHKRGLNLIEEDPTIETGLSVAVSDLDVAAGYPNIGIITNASRETTILEFCKILGKSDDVYRRVAINMTAAQTNAVEVCREMLSMPSMNELLFEFTKEKGIDHPIHS